MAPIACAISNQEIPDRVALIERMRDNLVRLERDERGMVLYFENRADVAADLRRVAVDEKRCCQFWDFAVLDGDDLTLRWDGPPDAHEIIGQFADWFQGTETLSLHIAGLL